MFAHQARSTRLERGLFEKFSNLLRELANLPARLAEPELVPPRSIPTCARRLTAQRKASRLRPNIATAKAAKAKAQHDKKITAQRHRREGRG